jgi:hypothetical protein
MNALSREVAPAGNPGSWWKLPGVDNLVDIARRGIAPSVEPETTGETRGPPRASAGVDAREGHLGSEDPIEAAVMESFGDFWMGGSARPSGLSPKPRGKTC